MQKLIINKPHLQSKLQKCGAFCVAAFSWLLWLYFLLPLLTLAGWLMGVKSLSNEVRWFGGYNTLLELLQIYGGVVGVIALLWIVWSLLRKVIKPPATNATPVVNNQQLCGYFQIDAEQLARGKAAKLVTVSFDESGHIKAIREG